MAGLTDTTELLATELVTNALQHTGGGAVVTATLSPAPEPAPGSGRDTHAGCGGTLRVEVYDSLARKPPASRTARHQEADGGLRRAVAAGSGGSTSAGTSTSIGSTTGADGPARPPAGPSPGMVGADADADADADTDAAADTAAGPGEGPEQAADLARQGTSGRGLFLVEALADAWGVQTRDSGKVVWFELAAHAA